MIVDCRAWLLVRHSGAASSNLEGSRAAAHGAFDTQDFLRGHRGRGTVAASTLHRSERNAWKSLRGRPSGRQATLGLCSTLSHPSIRLLKAVQEWLDVRDRVVGLCCEAELAELSAVELDLLSERDISKHLRSHDRSDDRAHHWAKSAENARTHTTPAS